MGIENAVCFISALKAYFEGAEEDRLRGRGDLLCKKNA